MSITSLDGTYLEVNEPLCRLLGRPTRDLLGRRVEEFLHPDDASRVGDAVRRYVDADGSVVFAQHFSRLVRGDGGEPLFYFTQDVDVTPRQRAQLGVAELSRKALAGAHVDRLRHDAVALIASVLAVDAERAESLLTTVRAPGPDGGPSTGEAAFLRDVLHVIESAGFRHRAEARMRHQALHDALTGLPNRILLAERVRAAAARLEASGGGRLTLLLLDLDGFKDVNDTLGHARGDQLLREVAERLRNAVRPGDTVVRLGGDEFAVLVTGAEEEVAQAVVDRLLESLRQPFDLGRRQLTVGASVGVAHSSRPGVTVEELLGDADLAMYAAKGAGRNRAVVFTPRLRETAANRVLLEQDLRAALDQEGLEVHHQPIVELATGRWVGSEALARWRHPVRGAVPPAEFIPIAEETMLIDPLGWWVLQQTVAAAAAWKIRMPPDHPFCVGANLSTRQLARAGFAERVARLLAECTYPPDALVFEMTESVLMRQDAVERRELEALRELGVRIAIDDFGTGYSSLSHLVRLPVDIVKLDRSFVADMVHDHRAASVIRAVTGLVDDLGLILVAEGIETEQQRDTLVRLGCALGQGYLMARPMPAEDFARRLSS